MPALQPAHLSLEESTMAKMFYTTDEAAQKLGINNDQLKQLVSDSKLREFRDGARVMFKVDQVDKLANDRKGGTSSGTRAGTGGPIGLADSGIGLSPGDSHASDVISLADSTTHGTSPSKDDTVVTDAEGTRGPGGTKGGTKGTAAGQQVFKPGEVKTPADTGAQTQIQSAIDDQLSIEGVGSGSGLLDLTRESDDTSLGAELLDEIYPGGDNKGESGIGSASGIFTETGAGSTGSADISGSGLEDVAAAAPAAAAEYIEPTDPMAGAFGGLAFASVLMSVVTALITLAFFQGLTPSWMTSLTQSTTNVLIFAVILAVVTAALAGFGFFLGKSR
jgi:excisionase family DNA binding protein